jgi:HK97 family phage prohead protease
VNSFAPGRPTMAERLARQFWKNVRSDGGFIVSSAALPAAAGTRQKDGASAELPIFSGIQLAAIREVPQLKLALLRNRQSWAERDDDNQDDDDDDDPDKDSDDDDDDEVVIRGTPIPFDQILIQDGIPTLVQRGAFQKHLATKPDIRIVAHFNLGEILGRTKSGTATVNEDGRGLQFACLPPATSLANDLLISIQRKDVLGAAAAIVPTQQRWEMLAGDRVRIVEQARLIVASVVSFAEVDSIRITKQQSHKSNDLDWPDNDDDQDDDDDEQAAATHPPFDDDDRSLLRDMGIEASSTPSRPGLIVRATARSHRAALALEDARRRSLNAEGLRQYIPLAPKGR